MRRKIIAIMLVLSSVILIGCVNVNEQETSANNTSTGEESTYEIATSQRTYEGYRCGQV